MQTSCNDEMFIHDAARDAPNHGGPVPVYRALKISTHRVRALQLRDQRSFCTPNHSAPVVVHNGHATTGPEFSELHLWELNCLLQVCTREQQGHRPPCSATVDCPWSNEQFGPWNLPLRHDGEVNLLDQHRRTVWTMRDCHCATKEMSTTWMNCNCGDSTVSSLNMGTMSQLSFWSITATMSSIMREKNTARGALSPAIPALYMTLQLSFWSIQAKMPSILGWRRQKGT